MKIFYGMAALIVCLGLGAGEGLGAETQGKELIIPTLEEAKPLTTGQIPKEKLYSLTVRDADLKEVLFAFSKDNGVNIIVDPDVVGTVTVDLKNVTMAAALDALLKPLDLEYKQKDNIIRVSRPRMETRTFVLNYLTTIRRGSGSVKGVGGSSSTSAGQPSGASPGGSSGGNIASQVITEDFSNLWEEIEKGINNLITKKTGKRIISRDQIIGRRQLDESVKDPKGGLKAAAGPDAAVAGTGPTGITKGETKLTEEYETDSDGKLIINKMAGIILVKDYPEKLREVENFLAKVEETVQRQIYIEAKVIEVQLNNAFQFGIDWRLVPNIMGSGFGGFFRQNLSSTLSFPANNQVQVGVSNADFNALIDALSTQGKVDILSNPRVSTLNNQKAIIKAAIDDVYFDVTVAAGTPPITTATPKYITIGVILDVTPQIDSDGTIIMDIHPSVTERQGTASFPGTGQQAPIISVRETQTIVRVRDGQTILIAGLMQSKEKEELSGVPCLMNVPVAGEAFRHTRKDKTKFEIIVLITPTIYSHKKILDFTKQGERVVQDMQAVPTPSRQDLVR
ncbi:MAG: secretin and TonB N-terminal domain-containing protein [Deltaproteobacteria bacterium]|nr:secretin and TonB N-terminal domain-containing protein [Deltaproteobacteria bacterium]